MGEQAPKEEIKNHFLKAYVASYGSELHTATIKSLEEKLADQVLINKRVQEEVELTLKEAIDQLLGNKPVKGLDFENVAFTVKLCPTNNQNQEIEWPN